MPICQKCGVRVDADDEFCPDCGAKTRQQPTEAIPAREAQRIIIQQAQPKKHRFLTAVLVIIVLIFLVRACASFASEPQMPARISQPEYVPEVPAQDERLISIETPPPRVNPIPEPEPIPATPIETVDYYKFTGNKMVTATFVKDAPVSMETAPYEKGDEIDVAVELVNKLPEDMPAGKVKVRLTGDAAMPNFFSGAKEVLNPLLKKIDEKGVESHEKLALGPIKHVGEVTGKISKMITGQYCYSHPIKVKAKLYYTTKTEEIGTNLDSTSNPPSSVQVTNIEQRPIDVTNNVGELKFNVIVANVGTGKVISSFEDCFKFRDRREKQSLLLEAKGAYNIECELGGAVTLQEDTQTKTVNCNVKGIDTANMGKIPSELILTLSGFAYEDEIPPVNIWFESSA